MEKIIEVQALHKSYGAVKAVRGIYFYVEKGKLFAFLGPNGAGKSTTIDIICTFLKPDSGHVTVDGYTLGKATPTSAKRSAPCFKRVCSTLCSPSKKTCGRAAAFTGCAVRR